VVAIAEHVSRKRLEHIWWVFHHSDDPNKMAVTFTCYIDESGTDGDSPVAVVGGVVLTKSQFCWLDVAWRKCLSEHHMTWPLHMREFGPRGKLKDVRSEERRALFADAVKIINDNKSFSVVSTLNSAMYRAAFDKISNLSMYGACFANLTMLNGESAQKSGYNDDLAYVLDDNNNYKHQIVEAYPLLRKSNLKAGSLTFDSDEILAALQVADVVSWSTRRKQTIGLNSGFEPLADLFNDEHFEVPYEPEWMAEVAKKLLSRMESE
jgi:hypothetical protein